MKLNCIAAILLLSGNLFSLRAQHPETAARDVYDWKAYDSKNSSVKIDAIDFRMLQGVWYAYEGWYYGDEEKFWKDYNNPQIFEIRGNQLRSGTYGKFRIYTMKKNLISIQSESKIDSSYINLITADRLTLSFKRGKDFEKYIFQK
jgi:hypothetical protein